MFIDELILLKKALGKHTKSFTTVSVSALIFFSALKAFNLYNVNKTIIDILIGASLLIGTIHYSPFLKKRYDQVDWETLRIKFFNNAKKIDKYIIISFMAPITSLISYTIAKSIYLEFSKGPSSLAAALYSIFGFVVPWVLFYFLIIRRDRPSLFLMHGICEGVFKPEMIKENDNVSIQSDDERGSYSGKVILRNSDRLQELREKDVFNKRRHLWFNKVKSCPIDIGFGMYIDAPIDKITIHKREASDTYSNANNEIRAQYEDR